MSDPTIEGPPVPIRRPPKWNAWLDKYARQRLMSYGALYELMEGITSDEFQALRDFTVKNIRNVTSGRPTATLSNSEWRHLKNKIIKEFPKMSHYEGAWPMRAIVAKYVAYRRDRLKENDKPAQAVTQTQKRGRYVHYIGKPLARTSLKYLDLNESPLIAPAPKILSPPPPFTFDPVRDGPSRTPVVDMEYISAEDLLRFRQRKMQCIKCAHLAPLSEQAKSQRLFTKYISTIYQIFDHAENVLTKMGIIDDYTLALLLQLPEEDRRRMFTTSAYCNVVDGIEISRHMNTVKHEMLKFDSSPSRPPASSAPFSYSQNRASTSHSRPPASYPSYSSSSNPDTTSFTMKCNACDFQPRVTPCSPMLEAFLTAKGLRALLPVFIEWAIFTDDRFDMLRYWSEADRAALFNDDRDIKLTEFQRFALMMAFRQRD